MLNDPTPQLDAAPWYTSKVQIAQVASAISGIIAVVPKVGEWLHLVDPTDVLNAVSAVASLVALGAAIYGSRTRAVSPLAPLTLTRAAAEAHPNTVANQLSTPPLPSTPGGVDAAHSTDQEKTI